MRGRTCAPPLRRSLGRKVFRATLCVSHSRRRRSPSIPNLTINSATWRLSTPRSLPELIHTRAKCIISVSSVSVRSFVRNRGCRRQRRARVEQRPKAQPRRCRFAALAVAACGAHAHRSLRCVVPRGSRSVVEFARFSFSVDESREPPQASRACTVTRARERSRRLAHRRRFWRTATRAREGVVQRRV